LQRRQKQQPAIESNHETPTTSIERIWTKFDHLLQVREETLDWGAGESQSGFQSDLQECAQVKVLDPIEDELTSLALLASNRKGLTNAEVRYKAMMLRNYVERAPKDTLTLLASSLIKDVTETW